MTADYTGLRELCAAELRGELYRAESDEGAARLSALCNCVDNAQGIAAALERELEIVERLIAVSPLPERAAWVERRACIEDELSKYRGLE